jgi:hypothetical protein
VYAWREVEPLGLTSVLKAPNRRRPPTPTPTLLRNKSTLQRLPVSPLLRSPRPLPSPSLLSLPSLSPPRSAAARRWRSMSCSIQRLPSRTWDRAAQKAKRGERGDQILHTREK